jgi:hypothetical protein
MAPETRCFTYWVSGMARAVPVELAELPMGSKERAAGRSNWLSTSSALRRRGDSDVCGSASSGSGLTAPNHAVKSPL